MKVRVIASFCDKYDFDKKYDVGDIVDFDDETRISNLVQFGLVSVCEQEEESHKDDVDINSTVKVLIPYIENCEDVEELHVLLDREKTKDKPRETIVNAIETRVKELEA